MTPPKPAPETVLTQKFPRCCRSTPGSPTPGSASGGLCCIFSQISATQIHALRIACIRRPSPAGPEPPSTTRSRKRQISFYRPDRAETRFATARWRGPGRPGVQRSRLLDSESAAASGREGGLFREGWGFLVPPAPHHSAGLRPRSMRVQGRGSACTRAGRARAGWQVSVMLDPGP